MFTKNQYVKMCGLLLLTVLLTASCNRPEVTPCDDYRQAMRDFVVRISETARSQHPDFIVIPQNGIELVTVGEDANAEDYRYYWQSEWKRDKPAWLARENPEWRGNYKVRYWDPAWQEIICGAGDSYLNRILASSFDGVYLDIVDAFEYFEK